jgi:hypothetical protein
LSGTAQTETVTGTPPNETTHDNTDAVNGTITGSTVELRIGGDNPVFGQLLASSLTITRPETNGQEVTDQYSASTPDQYNTLVSQLQQSVASANSSAQQAAAQAQAAQHAAQTAQEATMKASCIKHGGDYQGSGGCWNVPDGRGHTFYVPLNPDGSPQSGTWPSDTSSSTAPQTVCTGSDGAMYTFNSSSIPPGYSNCHPQ